jgi:hypothetical protein|tara:strand:- start:764 stop:976 length:213 start_codon:yes stop_codon:yes gene_type:complete
MENKEQLTIIERYDNLPVLVKEDINFPTTYMSLTNAQESFIIEILNGYEKTIKKNLLAILDEMKETIDEL